MTRSAVRRVVQLLRDWRLLFFVTTVYLLFPLTVHADEPWYRGYEIAVGVAHHQIDMEVYDPDSLDTYGTLTGGGLVQPRFSMTTVFNAFSEGGRVGYYVEYGADSIEMSRQLLGQGGDGAEVDLGTSARGYFFHVTPTLLWDALRIDGHRLTLGVGVGWGYLKMNGTIVFTEVAQQPKHKFDIEMSDISVGLLLAYRYKDWFFRISEFAPSVESGGYVYMIQDFKLELAYAFTL